MAKIIVPVITVLDENEKPDYAGNQKVIDHLIRSGVDGILVLGSAGECPNFSVEDKLRYLEFYADHVAGRVELFAGSGCVSYADTLRISKAALALGYTPMVIGPYYFGMDQEKLFLYYDRLAKELQGDMYLYNYPARTGHSIDPETVKRLVQNNPNIKGLKDSVSDQGHTNMVFRAVEGYDFTVYSGFDDQFLPNVANGGGGCIGALSIIAPELWSSLITAYNAQDHIHCQQLYHLIQKLMPLYSMDTNCSFLMKQLLVHRGVDIDPRAVFPFSQISAQTLTAAQALLDSVLQEFAQLV